jgi:hypothetical protein
VDEEVKGQENLLKKKIGSEVRLDDSLYALLRTAKSRGSSERKAKNRNESERDNESGAKHSVSLSFQYNRVVQRVKRNS